MKYRYYVSHTGRGDNGDQAHMLGRISDEYGEIIHMQVMPDGDIVVVSRKLEQRCADGEHQWEISEVSSDSGYRQYAWRCATCGCIGTRAGQVAENNEKGRA